VQDVVSVLKDIMNSSPALLLPVLDTIAALSLSPTAMEAINSHARGTAVIPQCSAGLCACHSPF
jgi:hypothetical protein